MRETDSRGVIGRERPAVRALLALIIVAGAAVAVSARAAKVPMSDVVDLPVPAVDSGVSLERALRERRSVWAFDDAVVTRLLRLEPGEEPLVLMPLGRPDSR